MLPRWLTFPLLFLLFVVLACESTYLYYREHLPRENPYDPIIVGVAREDGVDPFLIRALIWRESRFNPQTHGSADERGLMQVRPDVGQMWAKANKITDYTDDQLYDPETNIRVGTWYLNRAIKHWNQMQVDDPVTFALADYNAGRTNAYRWVDPANPHDSAAFMNRITFPSTRKYVEVILEQREYYRHRLADNRWYKEFASNDPTVTATP